MSGVYVRGYMSGGICPGVYVRGYMSGGICPGVFVQGIYVIEPHNNVGVCTWRRGALFLSL